MKKVVIGNFLSKSLLNGDGCVWKCFSSLTVFPVSYPIIFVLKNKPTCMYYVSKVQSQSRSYMQKEFKQVKKKIIFMMDKKELNKKSNAYGISIHKTQP